MELNELAGKAISAGNFSLSFTLYEAIAKMESLQKEVFLQKQLIEQLEDRVHLQDAYINQIQAVLE
jgi:hypothetical protein